MADTSNANITFDGFDEATCIHCGTVLNIADREPFTPIQCTKCHNSFPVPAQLGDYILLDKLGQGGMGSVFRGFDPKLKRSVAVKVMHRKLGGNQEFTGQFLREAQTLASLNNPNVVQVHNFGEKHGQPYIVMELVDGGRLDRMIKEHGALKESFVVRTALDVIKGLHAAANMGLAHGDLKPDNVLFDRDGNAKVVDFGLARFKGEVHRPGEIWGTPFYIAPEVVRGKQPNTNADIYSLGCTLFHALAGRPPFSKESVQDTVLARLKEPPPDLRTICPEIHPETAAVVDRMLEADPFIRYPNYDSLITDMTAAQKALETDAVSTPQRRGKSAAPVVITIMAAIAVAGFAAYKMTHRETPLPQQQKQQVMKLIGGKLVAVDIPQPAPVAAAKPTDREPSVAANDDAGYYTEWVDGSSGGTGFGRWILRCGGNAGFFIGTSLDNSGGVGGIDTRGKSWGLFTHSKGYADAYRLFTAGPLAVSPQRFTFDFDNGAIELGGSSAGWGLQNATSNTLWEFYSAGGETYIMRDGNGEANSGIQFTTNGLHFEFRLTERSKYSVMISSGGMTNMLAGKLIEDPDQRISMLHLWSFNVGRGKDHDVYFNNLRIAE
jgi:hypothetical protein